MKFLILFYLAKGIEELKSGQAFVNCELKEMITNAKQNEVIIKDFVDKNNTFIDTNLKNIEELKCGQKHMNEIVKKEIISIILRDDRLLQELVHKNNAMSDYLIPTVKEIKLISQNRQNPSKSVNVDETITKGICIILGTKSKFLICC